MNKHGQWPLLYFWGAYGHRAKGDPDPAAENPATI